MALRKILSEEESALHKVCKPVTSFDKKLYTLLDDMRDTLIDSGGVGLAAPQVGILRRVVLVDTGDEIVELINPELISTDGEQTGPEGCLEEKEVAQAQEAGLQVCTLGRRILRCETAPLCALSAVMYATGEF